MKNGIKDIRQRLLLNQTELATLLGITHFTVCRYESNAHSLQPSLKVMRRLIEIGKECGMVIKFDDIITEVGTIY
jgi:DNA-binding XRE family transcriptional regulator